ncbi:MAG: tRNA (adenosine(37)-N6)-threonylcarbamoyltransferase complex ATPase subunit type 1 TsaE [Verrucomicrobia bacterium]|nr:tRNA (adenosine(37)-N6)-threonylcarbamoyltransferase complex ATPase subunit type 1 TsaE [Verrucomicrobiota bacterium]
MPPALPVIISHSPAETFAAAQARAADLRGGDVLALVGNLGAGKTQFVKGLAAGLGLDGAAVTSPTFTLLHEYRGGKLTLHHADFYRLETAAEAATLGLEEYFDDPAAVTVIEWADKFPALLPAATRWWYFTAPSPERREIMRGAAPSIR